MNVPVFGLGPKKDGLYQVVQWDDINEEFQVVCLAKTDCARYVVDALNQYQKTTGEAIEFDRPD